MNRSRKLLNTGYIAFMLSGVCAISSGIVVSILQEKYGFSYNVTGTLLSIMSIGNLAASFASGFLPGLIGKRTTIALLCIGYFAGYLLMGISGAVPVLMIAFLMVGLAKGCTINQCTILVGENAADRTKGITLMHAFYAFGALCCPFLIAFTSRLGSTASIVQLAVFGMLLWLTFMTAGIRNETVVKREQKNEDMAFLKDIGFWLLTALIFFQNSAESSVTGWLVTYYKGSGILSGSLATYTVTVMWGATLIARLLIAFVFKIRDTYRTLAIMGLCCAILYLSMIGTDVSILAILLLFGFAFSMAGINPIGMACVGSNLSNKSVGILIPIAAMGQILMPWLIGILADSFGLKLAMASNLVPCAGIVLICTILRRRQKTIV